MSWKVIMPETGYSDTAMAVCRGQIQRTIRLSIRKARQRTRSEAGCWKNWWRDGIDLVEKGLLWLCSMDRFDVCGAGFDLFLFRLLEVLDEIVVSQLTKQRFRNSGGG